MTTNDPILDYLLKDYKPKQLSQNKLDELKQKYKTELADYEYIKSPEEFVNLKKGGIVRCINKSNEKISKAGILMKIIYNNKKQNVGLLVPCNKMFKGWYITFERNYVFYKPPSQTLKNNIHEHYKSMIESCFINPNDKHLYEESSEFKDYGLDYYYSNYTKKK
jgi:hypothetical protein